MASQLGPIIFLLHCLFLLQPSEARLETFHRHKAAADHGENHLRLRPPVDHRDDKPGLDPEINLFFHYNDLRIGNRIPIYLPREDPSSLPRLLSREESESIPFSTSEFSKILEFFSFPEDSKQARAMRTTLRHCESDPVSGETKFCVSSLESMLDSVSTVFGPSTRFRVLSTRLLNGSISALQNYTILEGPTEIRVSKIVSCHRLPYPYAVFYCHHPAGDNVVHEALIEGDDGRRVEVAATCHMDTSHWNPAHVAFRVLGTRPGGAPVCHFFPGDSLVWLPK